MCLFGLHAFEIEVAHLVLWAIMHGNAWLVARESRRMPPLSHKYDKGHDWCTNCLNCIAMQVFALCCCELQVLQTFSAGRQYLVPTGSLLMADGWILCRWPHADAGGSPTQPMMSLSVLGGTPETLAVFWDAKQGKQRQSKHGSAIPSKSRACVASGPSSRGGLLL